MAALLTRDCRAGLQTPRAPGTITSATPFHQDGFPAGPPKGPAMRRRNNDDLVSGRRALLNDPVRSLPIAVALLAQMLWWSQRGAEPPAGPPPAPPPTTRSGPVAAPGRPGEYLFCFWNVENPF